MSEAQEPKDLRIAPGGAVIFEAVAGGPECKLVNTEKGLVISAYELVKGAKLEHRPVLTLTSAGVVIRGDLAVEGEIGRIMQCHEFVGKWKVSAGSVPNHIQGNTYHVTISPQEQGQNAFLLRYLENGRARDFQQKLIYNRWTGTLDKDPQDPGQDRCISFWNGSPAGDETNRIFAMRRKHEKIAKKYLCPWELSEDWKDLADESLLEGTDGSWGAEEEPP